MGQTADWVTRDRNSYGRFEGKGCAFGHALEKQDADLLRACRGAGGGNFGVIVDYLFDKLPPAPQEVMISTMIFPWAEMTEEKFGGILHAFGDYFATRDRILIPGTIRRNRGQSPDKRVYACLRPQFLQSGWYLQGHERCWMSSWHGSMPQTFPTFCHHHRRASVLPRGSGRI